MQRFALIVLALTLAAPVSATPTAATIVPGSAPLQADPPDVLADSSYSAFTCDTGLQIIGNMFDEQGVLNASLALEQRAQFSAKPGKWW